MGTSFLSLLDTVVLGFFIIIYLYVHMLIFKQANLLVESPKCLMLGGVSVG
jgi:hypothetical protein